MAAMGASETEGTAFSGSWVPYLALERGINFGPNQSYNKAVGGSTSLTLLSGGQQTKVGCPGPGQREHGVDLHWRVWTFNTWYPVRRSRTGPALSPDASPRQ